MLLTHSVQFYVSDDFLIPSVSGFVREGFEQHASVIVITTQEHRELLGQSIGTFGQPENRLVLLDAEELLSTFLVDAWPNEERFREAVGPLVADAARIGPLHIYGEMAALLWSRGQRHAAIRVEELWNKLGQDHSFSLLCAYPDASLPRETDPQSFLQLARTHTHVRAGKTLAPIWGK